MTKPTIDAIILAHKKGRLHGASLERQRVLGLIQQMMAECRELGPCTADEACHACLQLTRLRVDIDSGGHVPSQGS